MIITTECDVELEQAYDDVRAGKAERISKPGYWTVWKNTEGFVSVRRYHAEPSAPDDVTPA